MLKLIQRIKCLFGFHGKGRWDITIVAVRSEFHAIEYDQQYICEYCEKIIPEIPTRPSASEDQSRH